MPEKLEAVRNRTEILDHVKHEIGETKQFLKKLHWEQKKAEWELVSVLVKADMHEFLVVPEKVDTKNLKRYLNEMEKEGRFF